MKTTLLQIVGFLLPSLLFAQSDGPISGPDSTIQQLLRQRNELKSELVEVNLPESADKTIEIVEKLVELERQMVKQLDTDNSPQDVEALSAKTDPSESDEVQQLRNDLLNSLSLGIDWLSARYQERNQFTQAIALRIQYLELLKHLYRSDDFRCIDADLAVKSAEKLRSLDANQRKQVADATLLEAQAYAKIERGNRFEALRDAQASLLIKRTIFGSAAPETISAIQLVTRLLFETDEHGPALSFLINLVDLNEKLRGESHPRTAIAYRQLGQAYIRLGDLENAKLCYEKTLAIARKALGNTHPEVAKSANNLGLLLFNMGQLETAESQLQEAVQLSEAANGEQHFETATALNNLGLLYYRTAQYEEACKQFERTVRIRKHSLGERHERTAQAVGSLGMAWELRGDDRRAESLFDESLAIFESALKDRYAESIVANPERQRDAPWSSNATLLRMQLCQSICQSSPSEMGTVLYAEAILDWAASIGVDESFDEVITGFTHAVSLLEPIVSKQPRSAHKIAVSILLRAYGNRAAAYGFKKQYQQQLTERDRAIKLANGILGNYDLDKIYNQHPNNVAGKIGFRSREKTAGVKLDHLRVMRACTLCRLDEYSNARAELSIALASLDRHLASVPTGPGCDAGTILYNAACAYCLLSQERKNESSEHDGESGTEPLRLAMLRLEQARKLRYFSSANNLIRDPDLEPLRGNEEFRTLVASISSDFFTRLRSRRVSIPEVEAHIRFMRDLADIAGGPKVPIEYFHVLRQLHVEKGEFEQAIATQRKLAELLKSEYGEDDYRHVDAQTEMRRLDVIAELSEQSMRELNAADAMAANSRDLSLSGDHVGAAREIEKSIEIWTRLLGTEMPDAIEGLMTLGGLRLRQGDYSTARRQLEDSLQMQEKATGGESPGTARILSLLGEVHRQSGDLAKAESLLQRSVSIFSKYLDGKGVEADMQLYGGAARALNSLALVHRSRNENEEAERFFWLAVSISENHIRENFSLYSVSDQDVRDGGRIAIVVRSNLAKMYLDSGHYERAVPLYLKCEELRVPVLGESHPDGIPHLVDFARLFALMGDFAKAKSLLNNALRISNSSLHPGHPRRALCLSELGRLHMQMNELSNAEPFLAEAINIQRDSLYATFPGLSERQQRAMVQGIRDSLDSYVALATETGDYDGRCYEHVLSWKGIVFMRQRLMQVASQDPALKALVLELQSVSGRLARQVSMTPDVDHRNQWRDELSQLNDEVERIQIELSTKSGKQFSLRRNESQVDRVKAALPNSCVLVDFFESFHGQANLSAFIVEKDSPVRLIDLGPSKRVNVAIASWRKGFGVGEQATAAAHKLRDLLWKPLERQVVNKAHVIVSPDGQLSKLPLGALPSETPGSFLIEAFAFTYLPVPQQLPDLVETDQPATVSLLAVGDIDYDGSPGTSQTPSRVRSTLRSRNGREYAPLNGTGHEIESILRQFASTHANNRTVVLRDDAAVEQRIRQEIGRSRFVHLATHGFFASPIASSFFSGSDAYANGYSSANASLTEATHWTPENVIAFHPGLLSGIVLTGANTRLDSNQDDGILTAEEIASLNLSHVELAVLSACETGLGKIAGGEGVLGLQRAFQASGTHSTVTSLWKVDDNATQTLMIEFYRNLWEKKMEKLEALRQAQLSMLNSYDVRAGQLRGVERTDADTETHDQNQRVSPKYWAAFVLSGDWR